MIIHARNIPVTNILIESLNQDHPEWLIEPYNGSGSWSISRAATGGCRENAGGNPSIEGTSNTYSNGTEGKYKLAKYSFQGNNFYGGVGSFEMEGEIRSSDNKLLASAKIYQDMSIIAKACDALPGDTSDQDSLWPGIFVQSRIQNYRGAKSLMKGSEPEEAAEIICTEADCASGKWDSDYPPEPTIGDIELPKTQELMQLNFKKDLTKNSILRSFIIKLMIIQIVMVKHMAFTETS